MDMLIEDLQLQWASNRAPFSDVVVLFHERQCPPQCEMILTG